MMSELSKTWIFDLDGTLVVHNGYKTGEDALLPGVREFFRSIPEGDYILKKSDGHYCFVYDREGKCQWDAPITAMGDVTMQIVEVVTHKARQEYLAHLRSIGVAYIFADTVRESLEKMKTLFGVEKLVLTGGAAINGGFLNEDMIDELSIVTMPYVEGGRDTKALVDTGGQFNASAFAFAGAKPLPGGAVHLIFKK